MILTNPDDWVDLYNAIKEESANSEEQHVFIYASSSDADAVCALRILERLFKNDMISHGWLPVQRYTEIEADFAASYGGGEGAMRTAILINCGAAEDVSELLGLAQRPNVRVVVIDAHRPIAHRNNARSSAVALFLDEAEGTPLASIPPGDESDDEEEEEEEEDRGEGGSGSDEDRGSSGAGPRRAASPARSGDENASDNAASARGPKPSGRIRPREGDSGPHDPGARRARPRRRGESRATRAALQSAYYRQGASWGKPSACVVFELAYRLNQDSAAALWLAVVGLTDQLVHGRLPEDRYLEYYQHYEQLVQSARTGDALGERRAGAGEATVTMRDGGVNCRILPHVDFRFGLLWEWTLYDAMLYSPYVAARLQTYTSRGKGALELLLAKMGVPLNQAKAAFVHDMKPQLRDQIPERLARHAAAFRMADVMVHSFQLQDGLARCVNAVDVVLAATALLQCSPLPPGRPEAAQAAGEEDPRSAHVARFWGCYRALGWEPEGAAELRRGVALARRVQRALVREGGGVVAQRLFHNFKRFRIYDLSGRSQAGGGLLGQPLVLQRLAAFFQEQHWHAAGKRKPIVLVGPPDARNRCFVVGYRASERMVGNPLGHAFSAAIEEVGAEAWYDLFDTTVVEISKDDVEKFKVELLRKAGNLL